MPDCQGSDWRPETGFIRCQHEATLNIKNDALLPEGKDVCFGHIGSFINSRYPNTVICLPR